MPLAFVLVSSLWATDAAACGNSMQHKRLVKVDPAVLVEAEEPSEPHEAEAPAEEPIEVAAAPPANHAPAAEAPEESAAAASLSPTRALAAGVGFGGPALLLLGVSAAHDRRRRAAWDAVD